MRDERPTPLSVLLSAMHERWALGDLKGAAELARIAAPYLHARQGIVPRGAEHGCDAERLTDAELETILGAPGSGAGT